MHRRTPRSYRLILIRLSHTAFQFLTRNRSLSILIAFGSRLYFRLLGQDTYFEVAS